MLRSARTSICTCLDRRSLVDEVVTHGYVTSKSRYTIREWYPPDIFKATMDLFFTQLVTPLVGEF